MNINKSFSITINAEKWKYVLMDPERYVKKGLDGQAETVAEEKKVYFRVDLLKLNTVKHELWHVYTSQLCLDSAALDMHQMEEVGAELIERHGVTLIINALKMYKKMLKYLNKKPSKSEIATIKKLKELTL